MYQVIRRNGDVVPFDIVKIQNAIVRAFISTSVNYNEDIIQMLSLRSCAHFAHKIKNDKIAIEQIQDSVESTLSQAGFDEVAKAYIRAHVCFEAAKSIEVAFFCSG